MSLMALEEFMDKPSSGIDWGRAVESHRRWLSTVVRARLGDFQAAEDVLQEVALAAISQTNRPTDPAKVAPWLYRIALRKVINHHRNTGRRKRLIERAIEQGLGANESRETEPGDWIVHGEDRGSVAQALRKIPENDRQILALKYSEGWGYQELADHLGITVKTVEYRLLKARRALRAQLSNF
jgi:RNA polymerase sigma factor (sigma-70 family)